jgi:hypothetical protein
LFKDKDDYVAQNEEEISAYVAKNNDRREAIQVCIILLIIQERG